MKSGGSLVGISSPGCSLQYNPSPGYDLPGSGKSLMEFAMRYIALRVGEKNINCNVVIPGVTPSRAWVKLARARNMTTENLIGAMSQGAPMGRMTAAQVGKVVGFLASPGGRCITGLSIPADNGFHLNA